MSTFVVDTHALVWFLSKDPRLSSVARAVLQDSQSKLIIPAIVLAEIKHLLPKNRFAFSLENVFEVLESDPRCLIYPIDYDVIKHAPATLDIHDSLIVGVALALGTAVRAVITRDEAITNSGFVPTLWETTA